MGIYRQDDYKQGSRLCGAASAKHLEKAFRSISRSPSRNALLESQLRHSKRQLQSTKFAEYKMCEVCNSKTSVWEAWIRTTMTPSRRLLRNHKLPKSDHTLIEVFYNAGGILMAVEVCGSIRTRLHFGGV